MVTWSVGFRICQLYLLQRGTYPRKRMGCPCGVMGKAVNCRIVVSEFEFQSRYYVHVRANTLGKGMNPLILPVMGKIAPLLFFEKEEFGIKNIKLIYH